MKHKFSNSLIAIFGLLSLGLTSGLYEARAESLNLEGSLDLSESDINESLAQAFPNSESSAEIKESFDQLLPEAETDEYLAQQFPDAETLVPEDGINPGQETRSGSSYIGIGGNLGAVGGSSVGKDGLMIYSKIGLTDFFSVRPAVTTNFSDDATFLLPLTFDFQPIRAGKIGRSDVNLAPYIGAGMAVSTEGEFGPLINGGVDLPLTSKLTATAGVNAGFIGGGDFGAFIGIGYNIGRFGR